MFLRKQGKTKLEYMPVTPSTVITHGAIVSFSSGKLIAATSSTTALSHAGVYAGPTIASTDSDYASDRLIPVEVPVEKNVEWQADFTTTLVAADIGLEVDLTDSLTVNRGATSVKVAMVTKVISATLGYVILKLRAAY